MKKLLYFILPLLLLSCTKDDSFTSKDDLSSLSIGLSLNDFQLFVDNGTTSKGELTKKDSDFVNVFFDEVIINFQSVPSGFETDLTINPNDLENSDEVVLPLGTYSWTITNQTTDEISNRLSVYGSGTLDVKEPNISIDLLVETDYSLITVQKKYVSSSILKYGNLTVNMESNDDYYFGYIKSETDGITLEVVDNVYNSTIETVLEDILKCKHYSYLLDYSTIKTQSVSLVCSPMEVIENYLIPNNSSGLWIKIQNENEFPELFDLDNFSGVTQYSFDKDNRIIYFLNHSDNIIWNYNLNSNQFSSSSVDFLGSGAGEYIFNPDRSSIEYVRAGRETVYEINLDNSTTSILKSSSFDANHYGTNMFYNKFTSEVDKTVKD